MQIEFFFVGGQVKCCEFTRHDLKRSCGKRSSTVSSRAVTCVPSVRTGCCFKQSCDLTTCFPETRSAVSAVLKSTVLMFTLAAVGIETPPKIIFKKHWTFCFFCISVSCYSRVCSDEWGGAHDAADHDNDLCKVIYSFVWPFFLLEPGRVPGTLSSTLLKLQQQLCGRPGDSFTPSVWLYTERLADNKPLVHSWIAAWGAHKRLFALLLHNGTE